MYNCNLIKGKKIYNYRACSSDDTGQQSGRRFTVTDMGCPCTIRLKQHHGTQSVHVHVYRCTGVLFHLSTQLTPRHTICTRTGIQVYRPLIQLSTQPTPRHTICTRTGVSCQVYRCAVHSFTSQLNQHHCTICTRTCVQVYRPLTHLST